MQPPAERVKACCGESNNIACLAMFITYERQHTIITWSFLMIQSASFPSAIFEAFAEVNLCYLVSASARKDAEAIGFLGILRKHVYKNKIYFCLKKKSNVLLYKIIIFVFHKIFKLDFVTQIIYCIIRRCQYSLFILFFILLYQFLRNGA